jgi:hypothetical protein
MDRRPDSVSGQLLRGVDLLLCRRIGNAASAIFQRKEARAECRQARVESHAHRTQRRSTGGF